MKVLIVVLLLLFSIDGWAADDKLVGKETIYKNELTSGKLYSVKTTNEPGTYFWYSRGDRCVAKLVDAVLVLACSESDFVIAEDSAGDALMVERDAGLPPVVLQEGSLGYDMYKTVKKHALKK